jgi:hypothetical protein
MRVEETDEQRECVFGTTLGGTGHTLWSVGTLERARGSLVLLKLAGRTSFRLIKQREEGVEAAECVGTVLARQGTGPVCLFVYTYHSNSLAHLPSRCARGRAVRLGSSTWRWHPQSLHCGHETMRWLRRFHRPACTAAGATSSCPSVYAQRASRPQVVDGELGG